MKLAECVDPLFVEKITLQRLRLKLKSTKKGVALLQRFIARREGNPPQKGGGGVVSDLRGNYYYDENPDDDWEPPSPGSDSSDEDYEDNDEMDLDLDSESGKNNEDGDDDNGLDSLDLSSMDSKLSDAVDRIVETDLALSTEEELKGYIKVLIKKIDELQGKIHKLKRHIKNYRYSGNMDIDDEVGNLRGKRKLDRRVVGIPNKIMTSSFGGAKTLYELDPKLGPETIVHPRVPFPVEDSLRVKLQKTNEEAPEEQHESSDENDDDDDDDDDDDNSDYSDEDDRVYYSAQYQQEDLDFIQITTLPSTGLEKPYHDGTPKGDTYYLELFDRIVQNLNIWVDKYFEPNQGFIDIDSPQFNSAFRGLLMHTDFFKTEVFTAPTPTTNTNTATTDGVLPTRMARSNKLPALYRAVLFAIISMEIFEPWIVALDEDVIHMIREEQQLRVEDMFCTYFAFPLLSHIYITYFISRPPIK